MEDQKPFLSNFNQDHSGSLISVQGIYKSADSHCEICVNARLNEAADRHSKTSLSHILGLKPYIHYCQVSFFHTPFVVRMKDTCKGTGGSEEHRLRPMS